MDVLDVHLSTGRAFCFWQLRSGFSRGGILDPLLLVVSIIGGGGRVRVLTRTECILLLDSSRLLQRCYLTLRAE